jgi:type IV pilus assembly protein PilW
MEKMNKMKQKESGFSLIELLITIAVGSIVLTLVVGFLFSQQRISVTHNAVMDMQQGVRSAVSLMTREIRMAGYDPTGNAGAEIEQADVDSFTFTTDNNGDGNLVDDTDPTKWEANERIRYAINNNGDLARATGGGNPRPTNLQPIAYNVDALEFVYLDENGTRLDDDSNGNVTSSIEDIRAVQITVVAKSGGDTLPALFLKSPDNTVYQNLQGEVIPILNADDGSRRIILYSTAMLRNMGLPDPQ